jgi:thiosulfate dehydrogenase [quinone] large subunit
MQAQFERLLMHDNTVELADPPVVRLAFANTVAAPLWLIVRLYVGWQFLLAGYEKAIGTGWVNGGGSALEAFWQRIVLVPATGKPAITYDWYRSFIGFMLEHHWAAWFADVIVFGEIAIGIALILGLLTGIAAFGGIFLNFNFMLAGSASTNPVLFALGILLLLAWKVAGYYGLDHWLLPALGTPWAPRWFHPAATVQAPSTPVAGVPRAR